MAKSDGHSLGRGPSRDPDRSNLPARVEVTDEDRRQPDRRPHDGVPLGRGSSGPHHPDGWGSNRSERE